jgi:hypothetical protein
MIIQNIIKRIVLVLTLVIIGHSTKLIAQDFNPKPLLDSVKIKFNKVNDYTADVKIKVNVAFIKIPEKSGKLYFKKPNKMKIDSKGFAMLPKKGMNFSFNELFDKDYSAIYVRQEIYNNVNTHVIKVVPMDEQSDIILAKLWVDRKTQNICKIEAVSKTNGNFNTAFEYPKTPNPYDLPSSLVFTFDANKGNLPMAMTGDMAAEKPKEKDGKPKKATVHITYANFVVNKGVSDAIFNDQKKTPK